MPELIIIEGKIGTVKPRNSLRSVLRQQAGFVGRGEHRHLLSPRGYEGKVRIVTSRTENGRKSKRAWKPFDSQSPELLRIFSSPKNIFLKMTSSTGVRVGACMYFRGFFIMVGGLGNFLERVCVYARAQNFFKFQCHVKATGQNFSQSQEHFLQYGIIDGRWRGYS